MAPGLQAAGRMGPRPRVVIATPDRNESEVLAEWLSEGHDPLPVRVLAGAVHQVKSHQADVVVADARFAFDEIFLAACRRGESRTPLVVVGDPDRSAEATAERNGAFYVERPIDRDMLMCGVAMALVDGRPLRRSWRKAVHFEAIAEGTSAHIIDVSNEGMRLEIPRNGRLALPPIFTVRIPLVALTVRVHRVWLSAPAHQPATASLWCGCALAENAERVQRNWQKFVDLIPSAS